MDKTKITEGKKLLEAAHDCQQPLRDQKMAYICFRGWMNDNAGLLIAAAEDCERLKESVAKLGDAYMDTQRELTIAQADYLEIKCQLASARQQLEEIVCTEGCDAGVIYKSWEAETKWNHIHKCEEYLHENFSPLGDALVKLHETLKGTKSNGT